MGEKADVPWKEKGKLWGTDNEKLRRTREGSPSQGVPPAKRVLVSGCRQLLLWKQLQLLAVFVSLGLTPPPCNTPTAGVKGDAAGKGLS